MQLFFWNLWKRKFLIASSENPGQISRGAWLLEAMLKKVVDIKTKSDWLLKFQLQKSAKKVENFQLFFLPTFSALFSVIAQSCLNCACTEENLGRIFSLLRFFYLKSKNKTILIVVVWLFSLLIFISLFLTCFFCFLLSQVVFRWLASYSRFFFSF